MSRVEPTVTATATRTASRPLSPRPLLAVALVVAVALGLAFLPPLVTLELVFGTGLVALVVLRPLAGLYVLPFAVGFGSLIGLELHGMHVGPTDLLVGALVLAWLVRFVPQLRATSEQFPTERLQRLAASLRADWRREPLKVALYATLAAYLSVVVLSMVVATDRTATLKEMLKWGEVVILVWIGAWLLSSLARVRTLAWCAIAAGTVQAVLGLGQWAGAVMGDRIVGTFAQPNPFAGFLNLALPLAVALVFFSPDGRERWMAGATGGLLAGGEYLARSRGATLGIAAAVLVIAVAGWRRERLLAWVAGIGLPLGVAAWVTRIIPSRVQQLVLDEARLDDASLCAHVNNANYSTLERLAHWAAGLRMFAAHPLLGVGAGNYDAAYAGYATSCWPDALGHAHNYYITAAAETGIVGLVAFLALTGATFAIGWRATHAGGMTPVIPAPAASAGSAVTSSQAASYIAASYEASLARALALGFFAAVVALAVHNLFDDLFVHAMELEFALCLAALLAIPRLTVLRQRAP